MALVELHFHVTEPPGAQAEILLALESHERKIMGLLDGIKEQIAAADAKADAERAEVAAKIDELKGVAVELQSQLADLQNQLANSQAVTAEELAEVQAAASALTDKIENIFTPDEPPAEPV